MFSEVGSTIWLSIGSGLLILLALLLKRMSMIFDENKENLPLESGSTPKKQTKSRSSKATTLLGESQQSNTKEVTFEQIPDQACRTANRNSWDPIATLDEEENWTERTHFITQEDHLIYKEVAQNILEELISKATNTACVNNNQIEKMFHDEDDDFSNMPVKPRGKPMNVSANIPDDDIPFDDMPVVRRGGGGPVIPTEDPFDNIKITRGDGGGEGAVKIPDEDPFDSVKIPASASLEEESTLNNSDDFYSVPVKRRGATPVVVPEDDSTTNNDLLKENGEDILRHTGTEMPIKARGGKPVVVPEDHADDDFDNLPVKVRSPQPVMVPDEETLLHDDGTGETKKPKAKGVTFDLNLNNTEEMTQETIVKSTSLNDSDSGVGSQNSSAVGISSQDFGDEFDGEFQTTSSDFMNELSFLENCGENDTEAALRQAELARKSLYVRFDPLVSDSPLGNANSLQSQMNNLNFDDLEQAKMAKDEEAPRQLSANQSYAEISGDPFSPAKKSQNQLPKVEDELPIIDIAKVSGVQNKGLVEPLLYTQSDLDEVVRARENEWSKRYSDLEAKIKEEIAMRELLEQDHREKMECLRKENIDMKQVVTQYEKTIVELTENSHSNHMFNEETLSETVRAKEQLQQDLHSAETNLVDAYKRIEKLKMAIDTYKSNEDDLKASVNEFQIKLKRSEERYQKLKQHAAEKVESANIEINKVRKQKEIDLAGLQAGLKKAQSRINSLEQEVQQKARENADYAQICDDLIKKVSGE